MSLAVLMTADTVGGVWTYTLELSHALADHGVTVTVATMGRPLSDEQWREVQASPVAAVHESSFALEWMDDPWVDVDRAGEWLLELERDLRPDVVHLNGYVHAPLSWRAPTLVVAHSDVVSWWRAVRRTEPPPEWDEYRRRVAAGLAAAGAVVAPTETVLDDLAVSYGATGGRVVPNCRRSDWVRRVDKEPLVLAAGRLWDDAKNVGALARVAQDVPWPVAVAGDGGAGIDGVRVLGPLPFPELAAWLNRAAVFALPARYEPFGLAALEGAWAGCALVLGDISSLREVWGDAALFVDPDDDAALAAALRDLAHDGDQLTDLAARARQRAEAFAPERTATGYLDVYRSLPVASGGPR